MDNKMSQQISIIEVIEHYKRSILKSSKDKSRLLHCINKLYNLPVKVEHLQESGVGKAVNALRKNDGEVGVAAKALITKWKSMVAASKVEIYTSDSNTYEGNTPDASGGNDDNKFHEQQENNNTEDHSEHHSLYKSSNNENHSSRKISKDHNNTSDDKHRSHSKDHNSHEKHSGRHSKDRSKGEEKVSSISSHSSKATKREHVEDSDSSFDVKAKLAQLNESNGKANVRDKHEGKNKKHKDKHHHRHGNKHHISGSDREKSSHRASITSNEKSKAPKMDSFFHNDNTPTTSNYELNKNKEEINEYNDGGQTNLSSPSSLAESGNRKPNTGSASDKKTNDRKRSFCNANIENNENHEFKAPSQKLAKLNPINTNSPEVLNNNNKTSFENDDDSFDSSTGANFGDVLGMLSMQSTKKLKKYTPSSSNSITTNLKPSTITATTCTTTTSTLSKAINVDQNGGSSASYLPSFNSYKSNSLKTSNLSNSNFMQTSHTNGSKSSSITSPKPDLLASTVKLEPLNPNIALELPAISLNYKPRPLNQTVMDCVFNNNTASSSKVSRTTTQSDAEALNLGISSKTVRTKIYSGSKTGQIFQVPSLFDLCIRLLQKNIDALEYTGGVPFDVLKPVLERATPQQLFTFENYNPYLMDDSDVLWQQHVQRNYRTQKRLENETWREMFLRCQDDQERKLSFLADSIKQSQKVALAPIRKTQMAFVDTLVKPPRNIQRKQEQYGTQSKLVASPAARVAALSQVAPNAIKNGDMRLKVSPNVKDYAQISTNARPKKAPLMQKTLQFIRAQHKR